MLRILKYILGGAICSVLFLGGMSLIAAIEVVIVKWFLSFPLFITSWIVIIIIGLMIYAVGLELFKEFMEWNEERMKNK